MARTKDDRTKLVSAKTDSYSLRTTVPSSVVRVLKLQPGDQLEWEIESIESQMIRVTVIRDKTK